MAFQAVDYTLDLGAVDNVAGTGDSFALALAAGRLTATVISKKTGTHITVALKAKRREGRRFQPCELHEAEKVYLDTPRPEGPPTEIGQLHLVGKWADRIMPPWEKQMDQARVWAARRILDIAQGRAAADDDQAEILEGKICLACGRPLTDPESIKRNIGPDCWDKITGLGSRGGTHHVPGEEFTDDEAAFGEALEADGNAEDGAMGIPTQEEIIANDAKHAEIEKIAAEEFGLYEKRRAEDEAGELAAFDQAEKVYEERQKGETREAIEAELQQTVVDKEPDADLGEPVEATRSDLIRVPASADPREILKDLS